MASKLFLVKDQQCPCVVLPIYDKYWKKLNYSPLIYYNLYGKVRQTLYYIFECRINACIHYDGSSSLSIDFFNIFMQKVRLQRFLYWHGILWGCIPNMAKQRRAKTYKILPAINIHAGKKSVDIVIHNITYLSMHSWWRTYKETNIVYSIENIIGSIKHEFVKLHLRFIYIYIYIDYI